MSETNPNDTKAADVRARDDANERMDDDGGGARPLHPSVERPMRSWHDLVGWRRRA